MAKNKVKSIQEILRENGFSNIPAATNNTGDSVEKRTYDEPKKKRRSTGVELLQNASNILKNSPTAFQAPTYQMNTGSYAQQVLDSRTEQQKKPKTSFWEELLKDRSKDAEKSKMPDMRPLGSVIRDAKPGEAATRAGEVVPSALKGWLSGQANALGFLLDPTDDGSGTDAEMMFGTRSAGKAMEGKAADWMNRQRAKASEKLYSAAGNLQDEASAHEKAAKEGLGKLGRLLVDAGIAGTQMAADATIGRVTGTGMASIGARTFGQSAREALDAGASQQAAMNYASSSAAVEMLAEKMFDVGKIFGKGAWDERIEKAVEKWAKSKAGQNALRTFFGVLTESGEEAASDLVNPMIRLFIDSDAVAQAYGTAEGRRQLWQDVKHDAAIGGILGGFGTVVNGNRSAEQQKQAKAAAEDAARRAEREQASQRQREFFASNSMRTGTADAEAAQTLERNRARANRPQTAQALSRALGGEQISEAETTAILSDPELMEQMMNAIGSPIENGDVRGSFLRMMEEFGTPLQNATESPVVEETEQGDNLPEETEPTPTQTGMGQNEPQAAQSEAEVMRRAAGIQTFEDLDAQQTQNAQQADSGPHIDNRTPEDLRSRKVHAFQHDHPELHEHFVTVARSLQLDANGSLDTQRPGRKGGTKADYTPELLQVLNETGLTRPKLMQVLQDIIDDNGSENYADAKRVEKALDRLLSSGKYEDSGYLQKKGAIEGGTDPNSWEYALEHEYALSISLGEMTLEEARADWEAKHPQARGVSPEDSTGAAPEGFDPYSNWQNQTDEFHPEGEKAARQADLPLENLQGERTMKAGQTVMEAAATNEERANQIANAYVNGEMAFVSVGNEALEQQAEARITRDGFQKALTDWTARVRGGRVTDEDVALGAVLMNNAGNSGMSEQQYLDLVADWTVMAHRAATALQAVRILKNLTPTARLYTMQRSIYSIAEECGIEDSEIPADLARAYLQAEDEAARDQVVTEIQQVIADRIPSTFRDKWTALRYTNMLGNFKTQVRNLSGNTVMGLTAAIKRRVHGAIAGIAQGITGGRVQNDVALFYRPSLAKAAWADFDNVRSVAKGEAKYDERGQLTPGQFARGIYDSRTIFKGKNAVTTTLWKPMEAYRKATNWAMEVGDDIFIRMTYADAMAQYLAAHGVNTVEQMQGLADEVLDAARAYAIQEAQEATFHDSNAFSDWVSKIGRRPDTHPVARVLSEGLMPFRKTPANILVRGVEYSPLGAAASILETIRAANPTGNVSVNDAINSWAKTATGSAVLMAGWVLAKAGMLRGKDDDDKDQQSFDKLVGRQEYSLELPNGKSFTLDWAAPTVMTLLVGGQLYDLLSDGGISLKDAEAALSSLADPMINMSMLQGVNDTLDNIKFAENSMFQYLANAYINYLTQGLTNTMLGQAERTFEPNRMTTYTDEESNLPTWLQRQIGKASAKTPGWDYQQTEYLDNWGETQSNGGIGARIFNNFLNPSYVSEISDDPVDKMLERLNDATGDTGIYPKSMYNQPDFKFNGQQRDVSQQQKEAYQKVYGQTAKQQIAALTRSHVFSGMTDVEKNAAISTLLSFASNTGKERIGADTEEQKWTGFSEGGIPENAAYKAFLSVATNRLPEDGRQNGPRMEAVLNRGLSDKDTLEVYAQLFGDSSTIDKVRTLYSDEYSLDVITGYYKAANEEGEFWNPSKNTYTKKRSKSAMISYMMENYGLSQAQAQYMYKVFNP